MGQAKGGPQGFWQRLLRSLRLPKRTLFSGAGIDSLRCAVLDATGIELRRSELIRLFDKLPLALRQQARDFGLEDPYTSDKIFLWLETHPALVRGIRRGTEVRTRLARRRIPA
jgi:hypothetical protein